MPIDKPKPLDAYSLEFHSALRTVLAHGRLEEPLAIGPLVQVANYRHRWRTFLKVAKAGGRYAGTLSRREVKGRLAEVQPGLWAFTLTSREREDQSLEWLQKFL